MSRRKVGDDWGSHGSGGIQAFEDELDSMVLDVKPRVKKANKPPTVNNSRQGCNSRGGSNRGGGQKRPPSGQQRSVASGRQGFRNEERFDNSAIEFLRRPESPRNAASEGVGRRRLGHKVMLQTLNMTEDNQEMVLNTLKHVQDEDFSLPEENEYSNVNLQTERRFWLRDATLKVVEQSHSENDKLSPSNMYSNFALNKLLRYGFHKDRCKSALEQNEGDVGRSLEQLWCSCFNVTFERDDSFSEDDILERRSEEVLALSSIYGDAFVERIPNRVWVVCLDLPVLETLINKKPAADHRKKPAADHPKKTADSRLACRLYKKGTCRFEHKCRYRHEAPAKHVYAALALENPDPDGAASKYELEIRFPDECSYPFEPPLVAFSTTHDYFPKSKCLNVTSRLYEEARGVAADHLPAVFSLMGILLEDEDALKRAIESPSLPHYFSAGDWPTDAAPRHDNAPTLVARDGRTSVNHSESAEIPPAPSGSRSKVGDRAAGRISWPSVQRENRKLREEFARKRQTKGYQQMLADRQKLPAWSHQKRILAALEENQVVVVSGMPGCGKTTQVPQFVLDEHLAAGRHCSIVCTQPRRISAIAVAERVASERCERPGRAAVGYHIRMESVQSASTRLLFCTTGVLLRRLEHSSGIEAVTHIFVDEVHERSEESDFLLMVLHNLLQERTDLRVLLMSATLNADLFSQYFGGCPLVHIPGRTFPVDQYFLEDALQVTKHVVEENSSFSKQLNRSVDVMGDIEDHLKQLEGFTVKTSLSDQQLNLKQFCSRYEGWPKQVLKSLATMDHEKINYDLIVDLLEWIAVGKHQHPKEGAILVFLPGFAEISTLYEQLQGSKIFGQRSKIFHLIPLHSSLSSEDQQSVFNKSKPGVRKVVISTNIAETSITIDDVVYVVDAGKMKEKRYDPTKGMESLEVTWVSRANATQRMGRAGRVMPGVCFHLFTSHRHKHNLREDPVPEIQRVPLEQLVLRLKMLPLFEGQGALEVLSKTIEAPKTSSVLDAVSRLHTLGALDPNEALTPLGYHLAQLPVDVRIGKLMLLGAIFRCLDPILTIAACLSFKSPFVAPFELRDEADKKKREFAMGYSDQLTVLKAYQAWSRACEQSSHSGYRYAQANFLSHKTLQMLASMKRQFVELLSSIGFVKEGLKARQVERAGKNGRDGILESTGVEANMNAESTKLVSALICAALYPNVVQVLTPEIKYHQSSTGAVVKQPKADDLKFKTKEDGYVFIHPSSVNHQVGHYESPYLVYHEKVKTSRVFIRDCSMVGIYPLLLFGGGQLHIEMEIETFIVSLDDGWIRFKSASHQVAALVKELRRELAELMAQKINNPHLDLYGCSRGSRIIAAIVTLISTQ